MSKNKVPDDYKGRPWSYGLIAATLIFITATLSFVFFTFTQEVHLVSDTYYEESTHYDERKSQLENGLQASLKWTFSPEVKMLTVATGESDAEEFTLNLIKPSNSNLDRTITQKASEGNAQFSLNELASGYWKAELFWRDSSKAYIQELSFTAP
jgi:hypothetical protein